MSRSKNGRTSWRNISSLTNVLTSPIIMTGGLKPEYYIRKRILFFFNFWPISKFCKNDPYSVHSFLVLCSLIFFSHISERYSSMTKLYQYLKYDLNRSYNGGGVVYLLQSELFSLNCSEIEWLLKYKYLCIPKQILVFLSCISEMTRHNLWSKYLSLLTQIFASQKFGFFK